MNGGRPRRVATAWAFAIAACGGDDQLPGADTTSAGAEDGSSAAHEDGMPPGTSSGTPTTDADTDGQDSSGAEVSLLDEVIEGLGGFEAVQGLARFELTATSERWIPDEGFEPGGPAIPASDNEFTIAVDLDADAFRIDSVRSYVPFPDPPWEVGEVVTAEAGLIIGQEAPFAGAPGPMAPARWSSDRRHFEHLHPVSLVRAAIADADLATEAEPQEYDGATYRILGFDDAVHPILLWIEPASGRIARLTTVENSPLHRDVELDIRYDDWQAAESGVLFPHRIELRYDGETLLVQQVSSLSTEVTFEPSMFELPPDSEPITDAPAVARGLRNHFFFQMFAYFGTPQDAPQTFVQSTELAPGIHHLTGGSHHSLVVEQSGGYVVFEPVLYPERCEAIRGWIDDNLDPAPITHVIVSHHHLDHSGCLRTMVGAGAIPVVHSAGEAFFDDVLTREASVEPDALSREPWDGEMSLVDTGEFVELPDAINPVRIYGLETTHAADMVLPYLPAANMAFVVDLYSPGLPFQFDPSLPAELVENLETLGLAESVQTIVGGHGGVAPATELFDYVQGAGA